jgi:hypothetical protein
VTSWYAKRVRGIPLYLYFAEREIEWPVVKIGVAENLDTRMRKLGAKAILAVIGDYNGILSLERALHEKYDYLRLEADAIRPHCSDGCTEWFYREHDLADDLDYYLAHPLDWGWNVGRRIVLA